MLTRRIALFAVVSCLSLAAPVWATTATDLCAANANPCVVSSPRTIDNNSVLDFGTRELRIASGGALDVGSGTMTIRAGLLTIQSGGFVRAVGTASVAGGTIFIEVGGAAITGTLSANGSPGGTITMTSTGDVAISGGTATNAAISARALHGDEVGGTITITARNAAIEHASVLGGRNDGGFGGDLTINALESITITGTLDANGGDGGSISLEAGFSSGAGNVDLTATSVLRADPSGSGGFGGTIDIAAHGDAVTSGFVRLDGTVSAVGANSTAELGGGSGGCISITGDGAVRTTRSQASITVQGGGPDGDGGEIELVSNDSVVQYAGTLNAGSAGNESSGGLVSLDAFGDATLVGSALATAGEGGGEVTMSSAGATVLVAAGARIDVRPSASGSGGAITLENGQFGDGPRSVVVEGRLEADGASGGSGGTIDLDATDAVRIASSAVLRAAGALGSGDGGAISIVVAEGPALIDGALTATGGSPAGAGGVIAIDALQGIVLNAPGDARGFAAGGQIGLSSSGAIDVRGALTASSSTANGGTIEIVSQGDVTVSAALIADGVAVPPLPQIEIEGCTVTICGLDSPVCPGSGTGILSTLGPDGLNRIIGRDMTVILGTMRTNPNTGRNEVLYDGSENSAPAVLGTVTPAPVIIASDSVRACPACGNNIVDPPETCDDGNQLDGDGCSASCQIEAPVPGDANNDYDLTPADLFGLAQEIFDGDGDTVGMVSAGTFRGGPGADANGDGHITAADLPAIIRLLVP